MFKNISKIKRKESAQHMRDVVSGKKKPVEKTERPKGTGRRGRKPKQQNISPAESSSDDEPLASRSGRKIKKTNYAEDDDFDDDLPLNAIKGTSPVKGKNGGDSIEFINIERIGESDGSSEDETSGKADKSSASSSKKKSPDKTAAVPHIVKTSGGVTVYQCSKCPKTYERPSRLRRHFRKHTGDVRVRWYNCNICNKQFSTEDKLNKHLVRRHEDRVTTLDAVAVRNAAASAEAAQAAARARALAKIAQEESGNDLVSIFDEESPIKMETVQVKVERTDTYDSYDEDLPLAEAIEPKMEVDALATTVKHEDYNDRSFGDDFDDNFDNNFDDHFANDDVDVLDDVEDDGDKYQTTKTGNTIRIDYKVKEHYSTAIDEFEEKLPMVGDDSGSEIVDCSPLGRDAHDFLAETEIESLSPMSGEEEEDQDGKKSRFYKCSYCPRTFVVRENFADHMAYHTKKEKPFPCEQCDEEFLTQGTLHYHIESKHLKPRCEVCNERVGNLKDFLMHQKRHTKRIRYKYECELCEERFPLKPQLKKHKEEHHGTGRLKCAHCPMTFSNAVFFICHATEFHNDPKPFRCDFCSFRTNKISHQSIHLRTHLNEFPYRCLDCMKLFRMEEDLMNHMKDHEENKVTKFKCNKCGKYLSTNSNLCRHRAKFCKMITCDKCDKIFASPYTFQQHLLTHTDERPFKCDVCGQAFARPEAAKIHMRCHTNDRPYPCRICGRTFISASRRTNHERYHLGETLRYKCSICKMGFSQARDRNEHMQTHESNVETFSCAMCDQKFIKKTKLVKHLKLHITVERKGRPARNTRRK